MRLSTWTTEQILSLAHDQSLSGAAEIAADPEKWQRLGCSTTGIWGEFNNRAKAPQRTFIALPSLAPYCDCLNRKFPCRHVLGLLLLSARQSERFQQEPEPQWQPSLELSDHSSHLLLQRQGYQEQLNKAQAALRAYALWLQDMIHSGLAELPKRSPIYFSSMAQQLSDNGLYQLANELRQLPSTAKIPRPNKPAVHTKAAMTAAFTNGKNNSPINPDWPVMVLQQLGRHYLITQGFSNYDHLSPAAQADLRFAAGWFANPEDPAQGSLHDHWLVAASKLEIRQNENFQHNWLWGSQVQRFVLLTQRIPRQNLSFQPFLTGSKIEARLAFLPGAWPYRVELAGRTKIHQGQMSMLYQSSLNKAQQGFGKALAANPWLDNYAVALGEIKVRRLEGHWFLSDQDGYQWPLPNDFLYGWHLFALPSNSMRIFGEWNGRFFTPLSYSDGSKLITMHHLRGIK